MNESIHDRQRNVEKGIMALQHVRDYFEHMNKMNAALHLSDRVLPSPLAVETQLGLDALGSLFDYYTAALASTA